MTPPGAASSSPFTVDAPETAGSEVLLVDPALFTAPYDAALSAGLRAAGLRPLWATRALRDGEGDAFDCADAVQRIFYPLSDGPRRRTGMLAKLAKLIKAAEHGDGLRQLLRLARRRDVRVVHFQWAVLPLIDAAAMRRLRRHRPVVLTVHDVTPFNGKRVSVAQRAGFRAALAAADRLIVHTDAGRSALIAMGHDAARIAVVPHGLLGGAAPARATALRADRCTIVLFGKIQHYKGADVLVEALAALPEDVRGQLRVIVAGEPLIPVAPLRERAAALGVGHLFDWRLGYLDDDAVERLLGEADAFVFPYREIQASGVFLLVAARGRWIVASDLGAFRELIGADGGAGELVPPGDSGALAAALARSIGRRPTRSVADAVPGWDVIGAATAQVYREAAAAWTAERAKRR